MTNLAERINRANESRMELLKEWKAADKQFGTASKEANFFYKELVEVTHKYHMLIDERDAFVRQIFAK